MTPADKDREEIDFRLAQSGWLVKSRDEMNISAAQGIAVREFPTLTGEADYLLYADGKAIGVVEAKPKGHPLIGVETQSAKYAGALPPNVPAYVNPLPFASSPPGRSRSSRTCSNPTPAAGRSSPSTGRTNCSGSFNSTLGPAPT